METITFDTSGLRPIGTKFIPRRKVKREATIIGYHVEYDTDTEKLKVWYRIGYDFCGQTMTDSVPPTTVEMGLANEQ